MTTLIFVLPYQLAAVVNNNRPMFIVLALFQKRYFNTVMCFVHVERARYSNVLNNQQTQTVFEDQKNVVNFVLRMK